MGKVPVTCVELGLTVKGRNMTAPQFSARPKAGWASKIFSAFGFICLAFTLVATSTAPARAAEEAGSFILSLTDKAVAIATNSSLNDKTRLDAFRELILDNAQLDRIASFALGRYARILRADNRYDEYAGLFQEYVVRIYASRLGAYNGQTVTIDKTQPRGENEVIVYSTIQPGRDGGSPVSVNWRLIKDGESYKILDVNIVGAWMSIEQQSQFASIINRNGGKAESIIGHLQDQLKKSTPDDPTFNPNSPT